MGEVEGEVQMLAAESEVCAQEPSMPIRTVGPSTESLGSPDNETNLPGEMVTSET